MASFFLTSAKWSSSSRTAVYGGAWSLTAVDLRRSEGLVAWCRHDEPVGNALFRKPMYALSPNGLYRRRPADKLSLQLLEDCMLREPPVVQTGLLNPYLPYSIYRSRTHGHFGVAAVCFRAWFSVGTKRFSLLQPRDRFFFFFFLSCRACMCQLPGRQKDTARCHWQREVNVIRRPLPQATGRTWECLHASCRSICMRDVTEHVGTSHFLFGTARTSRSTWCLTSPCVHVVCASLSAPVENLLVDLCMRLLPFCPKVLPLKAKHMVHSSSWAKKKRQRTRRLRSLKGNHRTGSVRPFVEVDGWLSKLCQAVDRSRKTDQSPQSLNSLWQTSFKSFEGSITSVRLSSGPQKESQGIWKKASHREFGCPGEASGTRRFSSAPEGCRRPAPGYAHGR